MKSEIYNMDCLDKLKDLAENSLDSIVTDPPYGLSFMGKKWDYDVPSQEIWEECLRVLKPGGYLLSFAGSRTYHRMAVRIEDAGFEIRDQIMWVFGSGFPKSHNIGKSIDKINGKPQPTNEFKQFLKNAQKESGLTTSEIDKKITNSDTSSYWSAHYVGNSSQIHYPTKEKYKTLKEILNLDDSFDYLIDWAEAEREVIGKSSQKRGKNVNVGYGSNEGYDNITAPATEAAKQWEGWGSALKPAHEPIVMARKKLSEKTIASNVLKWGCGGINIDGSRVMTKEDTSRKCTTKGHFGSDKIEQRTNGGNDQGRFPANIIHDGSDEVLAGFPETKTGNVNPYVSKSDGFLQGCGGQRTSTFNGDQGSAARFFYCAKASKSDRGVGNTHVTVKPTKLMQYLIKLVTPTNGTCLDPFMGSGSTGKAAKMEGFNFVGIEREEEYFNIAKARIESVAKDKQETLF